MNPSFAEKVLDRIADLSKGNEQRTIDYIMNINTTATAFERQKRLRKRKQENGAKRTELWVKEGDLTNLKTAFPGTRGGVNWEAVINTALSHAEQHQTGADQ